MSNTEARASLFVDPGFFTRFFLMIAIGVLVAGFLTWFMYALIQFSDKTLEDATRVHILDIVRLKREESSERKERKLERPEVTKAPPAPATPQVDNSVADLNTIAISAMPAGDDMSIDTGGIGIGAGEGEYLPIVKVAPIYPMSASSRGIQGNCMVIYTVTKNGSTKDISVVDDYCDHVSFRRPSLIAAAKFKYKPRIINGEAVEVVGVRNQFKFILKTQSSEENGEGQ